MSAPDGAPEQRWRRVALGLAVLLAVAVAGVVVLWLDRDDAGPQISAAGDAAVLAQVGTDAEAAARAAVVRMTSYDWRSVESDFGWVDEVGTERFRSSFAGASDDVQQVVTSTRAAATGTVVASAPKVVDATHVTVLLFVDQEIKAAAQRGTKLDQPRVTMEMVLQDGAWLVDEVQIAQLVG